MNSYDHSLEYHDIDGSQQLDACTMDHPVRAAARPPVIAHVERLLLDVADMRSGSAREVQIFRKLPLSFAVELRDNSRPLRRVLTNA